MSKALLKLSSMEMLYRTKPFYETQKLKIRCEEVGVDPPTFQPQDNNCVVWRMPDLEMSRGGIVIPAAHRDAHVKGILMAVGPRARDVLYSNGINLGDVVIWARFAGWELHDKTHKEEKADQFIILKDRDILGSDDLRVDLATGKAKYVLDPSTGRHNLVRKLLNGRKEKLLALAASTNSREESETARRMAAALEKD
jgi:co-chaperonin GroES (HSP10)